jgi:hypothetical protein
MISKTIPVPENGPWGSAGWSAGIVIAGNWLEHSREACPMLTGFKKSPFSHYEPKMPRNRL